MCDGGECKGRQRGHEGRDSAAHRLDTLAIVVDEIAKEDEPIRKKISTLPNGPGVYLFRDEHDDVLYIGKAKSLRARVRTYFAGGDARPGIDRLIGRIARVEVIVTQSEAEALHLEQNLVKRHRPPFNVRLRDDKSFPYIAVTVGDEYPRVMFTRERHRRGTVYFGPYANAKKVRETLDVLNRVFQFRPCEGPKPGRHSGIPCLDFHIERCTAPCVSAISREEYRALIDGVIEFLSGETRPIVRRLEQQMREAAAGERFEDAARYRNRLFAIESLAQRQAADKRAVGSVDVIGLAVSGERAAVQVFPLRDGRLIDRYAFHLENVAGQDPATILESFCLEYYGGAPSIPPEVLVPDAVKEGDTDALASFLSDLRGSKVVVRAPARGEKRRLALLADENARLALESDASRAEQRRLRRVEALEQLRESLNLESLPLRIECFDISNIQGRQIVGSMAVFEDGQPKRAHYRTFGVRGLEGQDDFAAMAEVVARRFARLREGRDESFRSAPNLVVIDGGKGQLAAALEAIAESGDAPRVAVIALAKREEEVFVPGRPDPIRLDPHDSGLQLLQRIRDEAHRSAVGFHRRRRNTAAFSSIFDTLPGVGPARRRAILQHFGSAERFLEATQEELEGVPGLPAKTARTVYAQLHKAGRA
jgi:excinuclease ABC subunit C